MKPRTNIMLNLWFMFLYVRMPAVIILHAIWIPQLLPVQERLRFPKPWLITFHQLKFTANHIMKTHVVFSNLIHPKNKLRDGFSTDTSIPASCKLSIILNVLLVTRLARSAVAWLRSSRFGMPSGYSDDLHIYQHSCINCQRELVCTHCL